MIDITSIGIGVSSAEVKNAARDLDKLGTSADKASRKTDQLGAANARAEKQTAGLAGAVKTLGVAYAAIAGVAGVARLTDEYTKFTAQLKLATRSQAQYAEALADVNRIAERAQASLSSIGVLYARLNNALRDLGVSQQQVAKVTETVGLALKVSGATAQESSSAMLQLSQAFGSGVLRGEEFNAVNEAAPALMRALAESIGVPIGALRNMATEGQLTSEVLLKAFGDQELLNKFREQAKEVQTVSGAFQVLRNEFTATVAEFAKQGGFVDILTASFNGLAKALKAVRDFMPKAIVLDDAGQREQDLKNLQFLSRPGALGALREGTRRERLAALQEKLGIRAGNQIGGNSAITYGASVSPNYGTDYVVADVEKLHREQEEAAAKQLDAAKEIAEVNKKARDQAIKDLQYQIDFETDMAEVRTKREYDETQKRKQADIDAAKARADAIAAINQKASDDYLRMVRQQEEQARREYERTSDNLTQSITDALFRGFENGKGFLENFKDTLINAFKTLILRPQIEMIVKGSGIASLFSSGAAFGETAGIPTQAGGGFGGILSTGKTLFDGITQGFKSLNFSLTNSIAEFGANIANGMGGIRDAIGGFVGQNAGMIANGMAFIPAAFSLLQGDFKSAAFQGAGAAIGTAFGGPIGGAIGSFLGGAVGGLFGGKKEPPRTGAYVGGTFANGAYSPGYAVPYGSRYNAGFADSLGGLNSAFGQRLSGLLAGFGLNSTVGVSSGFNYKSKAAGNFDASFEGGSISFFSKYGKDAQAAFQSLIDTALGPLLISAIQQTKLPQGIKQLFSAVSGTEQIDKLIAASINLNTVQKQLADRFGLTVDAAAKVSRATGLTGDALIEFVNKMAGSALAFKSQSEILLEVRDSLIEGIGSLPTDINAFDAMLKALDTTTSAGIAEFQKLFALRDQFAQFTGAIDMLKAGVTGAVFSLMSPSQQLAQMQADLQTLFGNLGLSVPNSIQELMELGNSIDFTTEAGLDLAAVFPSLIQAFQQAKGATDGLISSLTQLDPNRFKTLVDLTRAQSYQRSGIPLSALPSYDVGTPFVPKDGPAMIHRGERILTAEENRQFTQSGMEVAGLLRQLIDDSRRMMTALIIPTQKAAKVLERFDNEGIPLSEINRQGERITLDTMIVNSGAAEAVPVDTTP